MAPPALRICILAVVALLGGLSASACGVTFVVDNLDGAGEGFNDPVLGAARLEAMSFAADIWGSLLVEAYAGETVTVGARMDSMGGSESSATLASASPSVFYRDFGSTDPDFVSDTWYADALANHLHGSDLSVSSSEIGITFNSDVDDSTVLGDRDWYYGMDGAGGNDIDFVTVALHEIGHGLNIIDLINSNGTFARAKPGIYHRFLITGAGMALVDLSVPRRRNALVSDDLFWSGAGGTAGNGGVAPALYAPDPYDPGSSVSHLDETIHGIELMSPFYDGADHTVSAMERGMLQDMGWDVLFDPIGQEGDLDGDGFVGQADLDIVLGEWGNGPPGDPRADADDDGFVGQADLDVVLGSWGQGTLPPQFVPEPGALSVLALGAGVLLRHRRR